MPALKNRIFILPIWILFISVQSFGAPTTYRVLKDMSNEWYEYNKFYQTFVPSVVPSASSTTAGVFLSDLELQNNILSFYGSPGLTVFIDNQLVYKFKETKPKREYIELKKWSTFSSARPLLILFYHPSTKLFKDSLSLGIIHSSMNKQESTSEVSSNLFPIHIKSYYLNNSFLIGLITLFMVLLVFYKFVLLKGGSLISISVDRSTELMLLDKSGGLSFYLIVINSVIYGILFYILGFKEYIQFNIPFMGASVKSGHWNYFLYVFLFLFVVQYLKVIYVKLLNIVTFNSGVASLENYILLHYLFQIGLFVLIFVCLFRAIWPEFHIWMAHYLNSLLYLILFFVSLLASYMIIIRSELKNIYLISYICTAELVPLSIAYRIVLG